jgi:hypothetical protein
MFSIFRDPPKLKTILPNGLIIQHGYFLGILRIFQLKLGFSETNVDALR